MPENSLGQPLFFVSCAMILQNSAAHQKECRQYCTKDVIGIVDKNNKTLLI